MNVANFNSSIRENYRISPSEAYSLYTLLTSLKLFVCRQCSTPFDKKYDMTVVWCCFTFMNIFSQLRIYGAPYLIRSGQAELALNATVAMFDNYEILFNMNYSLPKYGENNLSNYNQFWNQNSLTPRNNIAFENDSEFRNYSAVVLSNYDCLRHFVWIEWIAK